MDKALAMDKGDCIQTVSTELKFNIQYVNEFTAITMG